MKRCEVRLKEHGQDCKDLNAMPSLDRNQGRASHVTAYIENGHVCKQTRKWMGLALPGDHILELPKGHGNQ